MLRSRPVIAMPYLSLSSFVRTDVAILGDRYDVRLVACRSVRGQWRALRDVVVADCLVCWFGSLWFLPVLAIARLRRIPVLMICGGYDVANLPEIGYGNMATPVGRILGRLVFRWATRVAAFSHSAEQEARANAHVSPERLCMIPLGLDVATGVESVGRPKEPYVLVVGNIDESTLRRKGLLVAAAVSRLAPDVQFIFAGAAQPQPLEVLRSAAGPNARFTGWLEASALVELMSTARVIFQPSLHEGFGLAVAEGMLHGAIPVVSNRFSLPEVVGAAGFLGDPDRPDSFIEPLHRALNADSAASRQAREHVVERFPLDARRRALLALMNEICPPGRVP